VKAEFHVSDPEYCACAPALQGGLGMAKSGRHARPLANLRELKME